MTGSWLCDRCTEVEPISTSVEVTWHFRGKSEMASAFFESFSLILEQNEEGEVNFKEELQPEINRHRSKNREKH